MNMLEMYSIQNHIILLFSNVLWIINARFKIQIIYVSKSEEVKKKYMGLNK